MTNPSRGPGRNWLPPYRLEGDSWCFLGLASAASVAAACGATLRPLTLFGFAPLLVQATRYVRATSIPSGQVTSYSELSATALVRDARQWRLAPLRLAVDLALARDLGEPYGFGKDVEPDLRVGSGSWSLRLLAPGGRSLVAGRGLGALLLTPLRIALTHATLAVVLPRTGIRTRFRFERVKRVSPAVGLASGPLSSWALGSWIVPFGACMHGFSFILEPPRAGAAPTDVGAAL